MAIENYLYLSAILFTIGAVGVVVRRNAIVVFMCIELMLSYFFQNQRKFRWASGRLLYNGSRGLRSCCGASHHRNYLSFAPISVY